MGSLFEQYILMASEQLIDVQMYAQVVYPIRYRYTDGGAALTTGEEAVLAFPANVQGSITRAAERAGRRYVGHLAVPAIPVDKLENSLMTPAWLAQASVLAERITQTVVLADGTEMVPCLFNKATDPVWEPITFAFPQPTSRVMRRRTVGLGS